MGDQGKRVVEWSIPIPCHVPNGQIVGVVAYQPARGRRWWRRAMTARATVLVIEDGDAHTNHLYRDPDTLARGVRAPGIATSPEAPEGLVTRRG